MAVHTTYLDALPAGMSGMIANTEPSVLISREVETTAGIGFGLPVRRGTNPATQCALTGAGTTEVLGITVRDQSTTDNIYAQRDSALLMRKGVLWVLVTNAGGVAAGDPVWVTLSTGAFSNADVGSANGLRLPGCRWESAGANGALAKMRVNLDLLAIAGAT
jgi:hypothetical protein